MNIIPNVGKNTRKYFQDYNNALALCDNFELADEQYEKIDNDLDEYASTLMLAHALILDLGKDDCLRLGKILVSACEK